MGGRSVGAGHSLLAQKARVKARGHKARTRHARHGVNANKVVGFDPVPFDWVPLSIAAVVLYLGLMVKNPHPVMLGIGLFLIVAAIWAVARTNRDRGNLDAYLDRRCT